jgi:hypothetical protein
VLTQPPLERIERTQGTTCQIPDPGDPPCLLCLDAERRGQRTGERGEQETAAVHYSIT